MKLHKNRLLLVALLSAGYSGCTRAGTETETEIVAQRQRVEFYSEGAGALLTFTTRQQEEDLVISIKISENVRNKADDPVIWQGKATILDNIHKTILLPREHGVRISLTQAGIGKKTVYIKPEEIKHLQKIELLPNLVGSFMGFKENRLTLIYDNKPGEPKFF